MVDEGHKGDWTAAEFRVTTDQGAIPVAGWVRGIFSLDFRVFDNSCEFDEEELVGGWALTHIPTGLRVAGLVTSLGNAKELADRILSLGDWDFTDPQGGKKLGDHMRDMRDQNIGIMLIGALRGIGPFYNCDVEATQSVESA